MWRKSTHNRRLPDSTLGIRSLGTEVCDTHDMDEAEGWGGSGHPEPRPSTRKERRVTLKRKRALRKRLSVPRGDIVTPTQRNAVTLTRVDESGLGNGRLGVRSAASLAPVTTPLRGVTLRVTIRIRRVGIRLQGRNREIDSRIFGMWLPHGMIGTGWKPEHIRGQTRR